MTQSTESPRRISIQNDLDGMIVAQLKSILEHIPDHARINIVEEKFGRVSCDELVEFEWPEN